LTADVCAFLNNRELGQLAFEGLLVKFKKKKLNGADKKFVTKFLENLVFEIRVGGVSQSNYMEVFHVSCQTHVIL
jgi:hypothetical protein